MIKVFLCFFIFSQIACAQNLEILAVDGKVLLQGKDCSSLITQAKAINQWTAKDSGDSLASLCRCDGPCTMDISSILPKNVLEREQTCSIQDGPNCFNSSLVSVGILPYHRYTHKKEMAFWMNSPLCREREAQEQVGPGDVVAIRNRLGKEIHGFVHLTPELAYSKNGFAHKAPYKLMPPENVFKVYGVPANCQRIPPTRKLPLLCDRYARYFKCESMEEFLSKNPMTDGSQKEIWSALNKEDCGLSAMAFQSLVPPALLLTSHESVKAILELAKRKSKDKLLPESEQFYWEAIHWKADSLMRQIYQLPYVEQE